MLSCFPRDVLDEILNLIESVSEGFPSYSFSFNFRVEIFLQHLHTDFIFAMQGSGFKMKNSFITGKLLSQGYSDRNLCQLLISCGRYHDLCDPYIRTVSKLISDLMAMAETWHGF